MEKQAWKLRLTVKSPFLIGSHRVIANHYDTLTYVPAHVLQAAFSRAILESHNNYDPLENHTNRFVIPDHPSDNEIDGCRRQWREWYRNFSTIAFSDGTPLGSEKHTPTTYGCKTKGAEHPLRETLAERYRLRNQKGVILSDFKCKESNCEGRLVRKNGWLNKEANIKKRLVTKLELDEKRLVSKDESLYSVAVGEPFLNGSVQDKTFDELTFEAIIYADKDVDLQFPDGKEETIHVGAYTTSGYGRMIAQIEKLTTMDDLKANRNEWIAATKTENTAAVKLLSDLPLESFESENNNTMESQLSAYTKWFQTASNLPEECEVDYTVFQTYMKRSFVKGNQQFRKEKITQFIENGSVFVVKSTDKETLEKWLKIIHHEGMPVNSVDRAIRIPVKVISGKNQ